jgi:hypothetical protein
MNDLRAIRDALLKSIDRWAGEITSAPPRSTLRCGIAQKCYSQIDRMLEVCAEVSVGECGEVGMKAVNSCGGGKPLSRLTLGERVQVLENLRSALGTIVAPLMPLSNSRRTGAKDIKLLHHLSKQRNRFTHDVADIEAAQVTELLSKANDLCESTLIEGIIALQVSKAPQ